jgi:hypothetical protein
MINTNILNKIIDDYKKVFVSRIWKEEHFKWEAIKHFQDNWDIDAENFATMLKQSLDRCGTLLFSMHNFSAGMIINFAKVAPDETKSMFVNLFDESIALSKRISFFQRNSIKLRERYDDGTWMEDFQSTNAISIYLWLRYPEKYYIYKYSVAKTVADKLESTFIPQKSNNPKNFIDCFAFYDEIHESIIKDQELKELLKSVQTPDCYLDDNLMTLTIDVGYYIYCTYKEDNTIANFKPLSMEQWYELLCNPYIFNESALKIMKRIKDYGGDVSCYEMSVKYGESEVYYISESGYLARHIAEKLDLNINPQTDDIQILLNIIYTQVAAPKGNNRSYICRLKKNLSLALDRFDLSKIDLFENMNPSIWKINLSLDDFTEQEIEDLIYKKKVCVDSTLKAIGTSPISQGDNFTLAAKKGDYFYLCTDGRVKLLGQFSSNNSVKYLKKEGNWYVRDFIDIGTASSSKPYSSKKKWWTPNIKSTFVRIFEDDMALFQDLILTPYFDMSLNMLFEYNIKDPSFWILNANPLFWSFDSMRVDEEKKLSLYNENGKKRRIFQNLLDAKTGDIVLCFETSPSKQIVAIAEITKATDDKYLYFKKVENLDNPIDYISLKSNPELREMEFFMNPLGSFFSLKHSEYDSLLDLIRETNPIKETNGIALYSKKNFLDEVYMSSDRLNTLLSLVKHKQNIILEGAAGVGKTFASKRLAYTMIGKKDEDHIEFVQFHQNYSYDNFILKMNPDDSEMELTKGIFYRFCQKACNNPNEPYFFIIDEINRGNLRKIFGEVCMLMEKAYRGTTITLAYSGMPFSVPKNLYIIGMMNTAERNLAKIDYTLRRRFSFFEMYPSFESDGFRKYQKRINDRTFDKLIDKIKDLNFEIANDPKLGEGFCIGHSYFITEEECSPEWIEEVVEFDIIPLLSEYWYDDEKKLMMWEKELKNLFIQK